MKHQRAFVISLVGLILGVVFTACVQASPEEPVETDVQQPEATAESSKEELLSASEHFATNPELNVVSVTLTGRMKQVLARPFMQRTRNL